MDMNEYGFALIVLWVCRADRILGEFSILFAFLSRGVNCKLGFGDGHNNLGS